MANSQLYDKNYPIPTEIVKKVNGRIYSSQESGEGIKRAKFIVKNGYCTYQMLKRLKNFFDNFHPETDSKEQFELAGGDDMKRWVDITLNHQRESAAITKKNKQDIGAEVGKGMHTMKAQNGSVNMTEAVIVSRDGEIYSDEEDSLEVTQATPLKQNAIAVIYDKEGKVLLVKRSDSPEEWMPDKWALVGGGVEVNEQPEEAIKREVMEETGLVLDNFISAFAVDKEQSKIHVFAAYYDGDPFAIQLNNEHTAYGWFSMPEMDYIDAVPNLVVFVSTALSKVSQSEDQEE